MSNSSGRFNGKGAHLQRAVYTSPGCRQLAVTPEEKMKENKIIIPQVIRNKIVALLL